MPCIFDSHAHLCDSKFSHDFASVMNRADVSFVSRILNVADTLDSCLDVLKMAKEIKGVYPTAGIHPHYAKDTDSDHKNELRKLISENAEFRAVGETGLDFYYGKDSIDDQIELFKYQLGLAVEFDLPVIIHCRDAEGIILDILNDYKGIRGVFHCFSGDEFFCAKVLEAGFHVSFSGIVTFKNTVPIKNACKIVPDDKLLVETDSPYLAPDGHRGKRNEPSFIIKTIEEISKLRNSGFDDICGITSSNANKLFNIE